MGTIRMELLSDAIPGSGEGLAGIIDLDITHDERGIPHIPARRLKGILLESAHMLQDAGMLKGKDISELFGAPGRGTPSSLQIDNGYVEDEADYDALLTWAQEERNNPRFPPTLVLDYFTYLRSRTAMDQKTGTAQEDTLRTTRVLRKTLPETEPGVLGKPLVFFFPTSCPPEWEEDFATICKVTRHFGVNRSRGFGCIHLSYESGSPDTKPVRQPAVSEASSDISTTAPDTDKRMTVNIMVRNVDPLMITNRTGTHQSSDAFIPGSVLLGIVASRYIAQKSGGDGTFVPHKDTTFRRLFLDGSVTFSDLSVVVSDLEGKFRTMPAPLSVYRKKDKENPVYDLADDEVYRSVHDNDIALKGHISCDILGSFGSSGRRAILKEFPVSKDIFYHHRRPNDASIGHADEKKGGVFYQYEAIAAGYSFVGSITGPGDLIREICMLLGTDPDIRIGKSRTAQYGHAHIESGLDPSGNARQVWQWPAETCVDAGSLAVEDDQSWDPEDNLYVTALSDVILRDSCGMVRSDPKILKEAIVAAAGIGPDKIELSHCFMDSVLVGGFSGVWGLPRQQSPALRRGSVLVLTNKSGSTINLGKLTGRSYGERTAEGFGQLLFSNRSWGQPAIETVRQRNTLARFASESHPAGVRLARFAQDHFVRLKLAEEAAENVKNWGEIGLSTSFVSRLYGIVASSETYGEITRATGTFKERSQKSLAKFTENRPWLLGDMKNAETMETAFKSQLENWVQMNAADQWTQIICSGKTPGLTSAEIFIYYQFYVLQLLNDIKVQQRQAPSRSRDQQLAEGERQ